MKNGTEDWRKGGVTSLLGIDMLSRPREVGEFYAFYRRWNSQIFAFCLLVCGDRGKAEWLTEETFAAYFRCADFAAVHSGSRVPVALLRFAADLGKTQCSQRWGAGSCGFDQAVLELPFTDRAAFILVSILRVQPSAAAVALRLRSNQLAAYWIRSALRLRWFWLRTGQPREWHGAVRPIDARSPQLTLNQCVAGATLRRAISISKRAVMRSMEIPRLWPRRLESGNLAQERRLVMLKRILLGAAFAVGLVSSAVASSGRNDDIERIQNATQVFREIMATPDKAIPQELLESAKCIAIIPGEKKAAFVVGGSYGKGLATCRTAGGWSAPLFVALGGGSVGLQIGGSSTDIVMIFMNDRGLQSLLSDKFKIGADATAAAGPVGRHAAADTDAKMNAEILTYSRSKGLFAGVSLDGAVVQADQSGNHALYGENVNRREILDGSVRVPEAAELLLKEIAQYTRAEQPSTK